MTLYYETLDMHEKKSRSFFRGNKKMDMKDRKSFQGHLRLPKSKTFFVLTRCPEHMGLIA